MNSTWSLEDLYRSIARQWRTVLTVVLVVVAIAVIANFVWPERYAATAVMTVEPVTVQSSASDGVNMDTERVVATSTEVLALAAEKLPDASVGELRDSAEVFVPRGADVLEFKFTSRDPQAAADSPNAIATAYGNQRVATAQRVLDEAIESLTTRIIELTGRIAALEEDDPVRASLELQVDTLQEQQANLTPSTFYSGSLVSPAVAPADSTRPALTVFIAAGLFLGMFLGVFVALTRARFAASAADQPVVPAPRHADPQDNRAAAAAATHKHADRPPQQDRLPKVERPGPESRSARGVRRP